MFNNILVTGGSGVLGTSVIEQLHDHSLCCLVHQTPIPNKKVKIIVGNIQHDRLGLTDSTYKDLCNQIDLIIHMAAVTNFSMSYDKVQPTNVKGTMNIVQLAKDANVPIYHVSTAFVHKFSSDEAYITEGNGYETSKIEAEEIIQNSGLPFTIIRPSIIIGDSKTGEMNHPQGFHLMSKLILQNYIPLIPGDANARIDFISKDYVAHVIANLVRTNHIGGEIFVTLGESAPTLEQTVSSIINSGREMTDQPLQMPKIISGEMFDRLINPVFIPKLPIKYRREIKIALYMFKYINIKGILPSSTDFLENKLGIDKHEEVEKVIDRNIKFLIENEMLFENPV